MSVQYVPAKRPPTPDVLGAVLEAKVERELIPLNKVRSDGGTQMRAALNEDTVKEYEEKFNSSHAWGDFPLVVLFFDGTDYWVGDGFHRIEAYRRAVGGNPNTTPVHAEVRSGSRRDAILYAAGANANHGLRRTNADKRRAVEVLLRDEEWSKWSDSEIARRCAVSQPTVSSARKELEATYKIYKSDTRTGADGRTINTANIGANPPKYQEIWQLERIVARVQREHDALAEIMRAGAQHGIGSFWGECQRQAKAAGEFRLNDLRQAVNNVAHQMEAKTAGTNSPAGAGLDPWAVAADYPGSRQQRSESLARAITPWIREYRDTYGRNWQDLALNGNPAHTNSTFWQDIGKECKRRALTVDDDTLKLAIKQAFAWLLAEEPVKTQAVTAVMSGVTAHTWEGYDDWTADDDAEYAALLPIWEQPAGTFNSINESRRITRWRVAARLASERRDNLAFSLQESARHLMRAERYAATQQAEAAAPVSTPAEPPAVNRSMTPVLLKGILRQWLGARFKDYEDSGYFIYQMLDNWMQQEWLTDLEAFKATLQPGWPVEWLDQAIRELHAHFAPDPEEQEAPAEDTAPPVISMDDLAVVDSVTAPALNIPMPNWEAGRQPDPEPESDLDSYDEKEATLAARRMNKLHTLKVRFAETIDLLEDFGELTGRNTATLLAGRELNNLIDILDAEMDDLQKGMRGV